MRVTVFAPHLALLLLTVAPLAAAPPDVSSTLYQDTQNMVVQPAGAGAFESSVAVVPPGADPDPTNCPNGKLFYTDRRGSIRWLELPVPAGGPAVGAFKSLPLAALVDKGPPLAAIYDPATKTCTTGPGAVNTFRFAGSDTHVIRNGSHGELLVSFTGDRSDRAQLRLRTELEAGDRRGQQRAGEPSRRLAVQQELR